MERLRANYHDILSFVRTKIANYEKGVDKLRSEVKAMKEEDLKTIVNRLDDIENAIKDSKGKNKQVR